MNLKTFARFALILPLVSVTLASGAEAGAAKPLLQPLSAVGMLAQRESPTGKAAVTVRSLLQEMVDRDRLPQLPDPPYLAGQASSYDRQTVAPNRPGWFANRDYGQYVRTETHGDRKEYVMMDVDGPGAITRWWEGDHVDTAVIRIYLDGAATPTIEENILALLSGTGRIKPPLAAVKSLGLNSYFPIPYSRHCKVTYDNPAELHWYDIGYRTYPAGTLVQTYSQAEADAAADELARVEQELSKPNEIAAGDTKQLAAIGGRLAPNSAVETSINGPAAIRRLAVKVETDNPAELSAALRSTVLSIEFDGQPAVWAPVGDFFGSGTGLNPYHDRYREVRADGTMVCWWVMPFAKTCRLQLRNLGRKPVSAILSDIAVNSWNWDRRSMIFHAAWREEYPIRTKSLEGTCDWNLVAIEGQGVYIGDTLSIHNGVAGWWGEGDEKIWVDNDKFPSVFGTGTEDYYGYSYGDRGVFFEAPFHAQPRSEGNRQPGFVTNTRTRSLDAIPFERRLKFDLEVWHKKATTMEYAATTYWYARPGSTHNRLPDAAGAVRSSLQERW